MASILQKEFEYYLSNQEDFVKKYEGKFLVIKNQSLVGVFDDQLSAIEATKKTHELGTFLVQKCERGKDAYTQTFHSRIRFA